jgi:hypothetical protein
MVYLDILYGIYWYMVNLGISMVYISAPGNTFARITKLHKIYTFFVEQNRREAMVWGLDPAEA